MTREITYAQDLSLPIQTGDTIGEIAFYAAGTQPEDAAAATEVARLPLIAGADASKASFGTTLLRLVNRLLR